MKKFLAAVFTFMMIAASGACVAAGSFDDYWDFELADGSYAYGFSRVLVTMDQDWYQNTRVVLGEGGGTASFFHKDSYNAYAEEGMTGGRLFTIGASVNHDFQNLPSFVYLGFDEEEAMNYYAALPTDYQAYIGDEEIRAEYDKLWSGVQDVLDGILIKGSEKYRALYEDTEPEAEPESKAEPAPEAESEAEAEPESESVSEQNSGPEAEPEPGSESEPESDPVPGSESEPESDPVPGPESGSESEPGPEPESESVPAPEVPSTDQPESSDYEYLVNEDQGTVSIVKYKGNEEAVTIPSEIGGFPVKEIGPEAFRYQKLKSVSFPEGIDRIGENAFEYCVISDSLRLPENVVISEDAFSYAELPAVLVIPAGAEVEMCAFSYCDTIKSVLLGPGCVLRGRAFGYCRNLVKTIIADGSRLEAGAFEYCRSLTGVILCGTVDIEGKAFTNCGEIGMTEAEAGDYDSWLQSAADGSMEEELNAPKYTLGKRYLEIINSPAAVDGVLVMLDEAAAVQDPETGAFEYSFRGSILNNLDEGIMQVIYTFALIDEAGEEFRSFSEVYDGQDTAIAAHTLIGFTHDGIRWGKQSVPAAVKVNISSVKTEAELPPANVPKKGEFLYQALGDEKLENIKEEPPVELSFHIDQGGYGRTATFTAGEALDQAVELLCGIQIGEESGEFVTDNYNWIWLKWEDGSSTGISLNLHNLEYNIHSSIHTYELEYLEEFWTYCAGYLKED